MLDESTNPTPAVNSSFLGQSDVPAEQPQNNPQSGVTSSLGYNFYDQRRTKRSK